jgi:hypothetical protein
LLDEGETMRGLLVDKVDKEDKEDEIEGELVDKDERAKKLRRDEEKGLLDEETEAFWTKKAKANRFFFFVLEEGYGECYKT